MNNVQHGSGDGFVDKLVIIMAAVLFFRTADVMAIYSPQMLNDILGMDVSYIFGVVAALCVEAGALRLHFHRGAQMSGSAQAVKWILLGISGLCQVFDGFYNTNTLGNQSETLKFLFSWLVPNIPLLFMALMFWIGRLPESDGTVVAHAPRKGLFPAISEMLYGAGGRSKKSATLATDVPEVKEKVSKANGKKPVDTNFTKGGRA